MRRVTIPTVKMEETIKFYNDVFGMTVFYDQTFEYDPETSSESLLGPEGNHTHRLVSLQQGDEDIGMLGLLDYMQPELEINPFEKKPDSPYPLVIIFSVDSVADIAEKVKAANGKIIGNPTEWDIPGKGKAVGMSFEDPNGVLIELTQFPERDPQQKGPVSPIRRVTVPIPTGKMEEAIKYYEEAMGLTVFYDGVVVTPPEQAMLGLPGTVKSRIVSMQAGDSRYGMVGLLEYMEPDVNWQPFVKSEGKVYDVIFVFMSDDMEKTISTSEANGAKLLARKTYEIPQRGTADGVMIEDPVGVVIDVTQFT